MTDRTRAAVLPTSFCSMTALDSVRAAMHRDPAKCAVYMGDAQLSYARLVERSERLRDAALTDLGLRPGDRAAVVARNCIEYVELSLGLPDAGIALATINPRYTAAELRIVLEDCGARLVIADADSINAVRQAELGPDVRVICLGPEYEALLIHAAVPDSLPVIEEWDVWTIPYTSGTTGKPKGVMLSHRSRLLVALLSASEFGCFGPDDIYLAMAPMAFGGGLGFPLAALSTGGSVEILDRFDPETVLRKLKFGGITGVFMVPTHFQMMLDLPQEILDECRSPPVKAVVSSAAPLPQALKQRIVPYFGEGVLHEIYAATEMGLVCNLRPRFQLDKQSCVGTPQAHVRIAIRDDDGAECGPGEVGEIFVSSPTLFNGYLNRAEETAATLRDGWASVGDMAMRDEDGFVYIVDRKKDMVISGGVNIYPREIEEHLLHHPAISEIAVIGVPDPLWGERLSAYAVLRPGGTLTIDDVAAFCDGRLANYKIPRELHLLDGLPRNLNGKVIKAALRTIA